jgi:hypothetical protein
MMQDGVFGQFGVIVFFRIQCSVLPTYKYY